MVLILRPWGLLGRPSAEARGPAATQAPLAVPSRIFVFSLAAAAVLLALGFALVRKTTPAVEGTRITTQTKYRQDFPFIGLPVFWYVLTLDDMVLAMILMIIPNIGVAIWYGPVYGGVPGLVGDEDGDGREHARLVPEDERRVDAAAMVLRYWYLLRYSWPRILDLIYWPAVQMLMWGFLQLYVSENAGFFAKAGGTFIVASSMVVIPLVCQLKQVATSRLMLPIQLNFRASNRAWSLPNSGSMNRLRAGTAIAVPSRETRAIPMSVSNATRELNGESRDTSLSFLVGAPGSCSITVTSFAALACWSCIGGFQTTRFCARERPRRS